MKTIEKMQDNKGKLTAFFARKPTTSTERKRKEPLGERSVQEDLKKVKIESDTPPSEKDLSKPQENDESKIEVKLSRKICEAWFKDFPWLLKLENEALSCKWCKKSGMNLVSPFGDSQGCFNYKKDALNDHNGSKSHELVIQALCKEKRKAREESDITNYFNNRKKVSSSFVGTLLSNAYFCCWNVVSINFSEQLNHYLKSLGVNVGDHYLDHNAIREMLLSLGYTIQKSLSTEVEDSGSFISVLLDESTDNANESKLLIMLRFCEGFTPKEKYLAICKLTNATAENIYKQVSSVLKEEGYLSSKLISVLGDNAPTIQGEISGVITRLKADLPYIKEGRCVSHLNNLIIKSLVNKFPKVSATKTFIYKLVDFFRKSPRKNQIFMSCMEEEEQDLKSLVMPFDIRWASLYNSISRIIEVFGSLVNTLEKIDDEEDDATAFGFFTKLTQMDTLSIILILNDLLFPFYQIDQALQKSGCTIGTALERIQVLKDNLNFLYKKEDDYGWWLGNFKEEFESTGTFKGIKILNKFNQDWKQIRKTAVAYKSFLLEAITSKFASLEGYKVFDILDFGNLRKEMKKWLGNRSAFKRKEVSELLTFYNNHVAPGYQLSEKTIYDEWNLVTSHITNTKSEFKNTDMYEELNDLEIAPSFIKIIKLYLAYPVSNAPVERGFSLMNIIKSEVRTCMKDDLLDSSLAIKYNGPEPDSVSLGSQFYVDAENHWKDQKKRY